MPPSRDSARQGRFAQHHLVDATYAELIGLCRGILADGAIVDAEVVTLSAWLQSNEASLPKWPGLLLARRVRAIAEDGEIDEGERQDLKTFLEQIAGDSDSTKFDESTALPFTDPEPFVEYSGKSFCLTGTFVFGRRAQVEAAIRDQGGVVVETVAKADYLIIGETVTPSWKFRTHGRKIEEAVQVRAGGHRIAVISEYHWGASLC